MQLLSGSRLSVFDTVSTFPDEKDLDSRKQELQIDPHIHPVYVDQIKQQLVLRVLRDGEIVGLEKGEGFADAGDGNYGAAFSKAFSDALSVSLSRLP